MIADGDLDGDMYFCLWDEAIVGTLLNEEQLINNLDGNSKELLAKSKQILTRLEAPDTNCAVDKDSKLNKPHDPEWFSKAQAALMDVEKKSLSVELVGKLYGLCIASSDIYDEDAVAFGRAYKDALVRALLVLYIFGY